MEPQCLDIHRTTRALLVITRVIESSGRPLLPPIAKAWQIRFVWHCAMATGWQTFLPFGCMPDLLKKTLFGNIVRQEKHDTFNAPNHVVVRNDLPL